MRRDKYRCIGGRLRRLMLHHGMYSRTVFAQGDSGCEIPLEPTKEDYTQMMH